MNKDDAQTKGGLAFYPIFVMGSGSGWELPFIFTYGDNSYC